MIGAEHERMNEMRSIISLNSADRFLASSRRPQTNEALKDVTEEHARRMR
jgi:hypothetical protein